MAWARNVEQNSVIAFEKRTGTNSYKSNHHSTIIREIYEKTDELKATSREPLFKTKNLEKKRTEVNHHVKNRRVVYKKKHHMELRESILLVGGCDGVSWSSALNAYTPSNDGLRTFEPMSSDRAGASVARFDGELYVLGGFNDYTVLESVESYNFESYEWTVRPPMRIRRCNFGCAALNGRLLAVGGRNGVQHLSSMDMFDPVLGRWISGRSMLRQRYALGSVVLNGAFYAVGGYDGRSILRSGERFDPREHSWRTIRPMNRARRGHSLVALGEQIYAIGGYDGGEMLADVEIYEPRVGTWRTEEEMIIERGYLSAAALNGAIYAIGGVNNYAEVEEIVECYREGRGWENIGLSAVGGICLAGTIVYGENEFIPDGF